VVAAGAETRADPFLVLGLETSCDETAAAVVANGAAVLSSVVSSQVDLHARFGGVVPEIASRAHVELLTPVMAEALVEAGVTDGVDAVAATVGPGLAGALLIGVSAAAGSMVRRSPRAIAICQPTRSSPATSWSPPASTARSAIPATSE